METEEAVFSEVPEDTNKEISLVEEPHQENDQKVPEIHLQDDEMANECDSEDPKDKTTGTKVLLKASQEEKRSIKEDFSQFKAEVLKMFREKDTNQSNQAGSKPAPSMLNMMKEDLSQFKEDMTSVFGSSKETKSTDPKTSPSNQAENKLAPSMLNMMKEDLSQLKEDMTSVFGSSKETKSTDPNNSQSAEKTINRFFNFKDDLSNVFKISLSKERDNKGVAAKEDSSNTFKSKAKRTDEPFLQSLFRRDQNTSQKAENSQEVKTTLSETSEKQMHAGFRGNLSEQNDETVNSQKIHDDMSDRMDTVEDSEVDRCVSEETTTGLSEKQQTEETIPTSVAAEQRWEELSEDSSVVSAEQQINNREEEEKEEEQQQQKEKQEEEQEKEKQEKETEKEKQEEEQEKEKQEEEQEKEKKEEEQEKEKQEEEQEKEKQEEEQEREKQEEEQEKEKQEEEPEREKQEEEQEREKQEEEQEREKQEEEPEREKQEEEQEREKQEEEQEREKQEEDKSSETLPWEPLIDLFSLRNTNKDDIRGQPGGDLWSVKNFACYLTLDPNTANSELHLTDGNRKATRVWSDHRPSEHPERFERCPQLLCREGLLDSVYWEVMWSGGADIGVTYNSISRDGDTASCLLGHNERSWSLECSEGSYTPCHSNKRFRSSSPRPFTHRVGVYLNWSAGSLSFYCVSHDTMVHLHTFNSTFTEPLYPGFWVWAYDGSVLLSQVELDWERLLQ